MAEAAWATNRHALRQLQSPDAPETAEFRDSRGRLRVDPFLRDGIHGGRARHSRHRLRERLPAAVPLLPQPGYLASQGRHARLLRARRARPRIVCGAAARHGRRVDDLGRGAAGPGSFHQDGCSPPPSAWGFTPPSTRRGSSARGPTTSTSARSTSCCSTSSPGIPRPTAGPRARRCGPTLAFAERLAALEQAGLGPLRAGARPHRRSCECRGHRPVRRADDQCRMGRGAAVPSDGRLQVEGAGARLQAVRHADTVSRAGRAGARTVPRCGLPGKVGER